MLTPGLQTGHGIEGIPGNPGPIPAASKARSHVGASATGDGINNWDMSTGTQWDGEYGLWEPSGTASGGWLGSPGMPQWRGSPVGITAPIWCVPVRDGGAQSCLDEADELRSSLCLLRSRGRPNPRSISCPDRCRYNTDRVISCYNTEDHEGCWLPLLHDEDNLQVKTF